MTTNYTKKELLYDGNEKQIFATEDPDKVIIRYKDVTTAYNNIKRARFDGIGVYNNKISALLFEELAKEGIENHFIDLVSDREQLCRRIAWVNIVVVVHNWFAGTLSRHLNIAEGVKCPNVIVDLRYNTDELDNPLINNDQAVALGLASYPELQTIDATARKINEILLKRFSAVGINLIDFKLEFGRTPDGKIILSDELSPDRCRLWDAATGKKLDKDRFRQDLGYILDGYKEVYERLTKQ
ncbi:MAG: phosphoribosylaminoimidazolesuccinocarboxamide synthase [Bacteroidales bacterium]|nr:phosphoribosylaminoimidazolesuccinocarboxamide synthase [Bacteroidales bacterium]